MRDGPVERSATALARGPTAVDPTPAPRLPSLTALRVFAALLVFGQHSRFLFAHTGWFGTVDRYLSRGGSGVGFFFVLSGFVLTWSRRSDDRPRPFFDRRASRIYPDYVVVWFGSLVLVGVGIAGATSAGAALANLLLIQAWFPSPAWHYGLNAVSWSLSCEAFFYLCFPFIVGSVIGLGRRHRQMATVALVALAIGIQITLHLAEPRLGAERVEYLAYVFPPTRLIEFVLGMLLVGLVRDGLPRVPFRTAAALAVVAVLASAWVPFPASHVAVTLVPFMILIVAAAQADLAGSRGVGRSRWLVHLGLVSYAFYLVHDLVLVTFRDRVGLPERPVWTALLLLVGLLGVSVAVAEGLFRLVEQPCERRWRSRRSQVPRF